MSTRSCPDWPMLLEVAPDLHFKHYTLAEARLPAEVIVNIPDVPQEAVAICADLEHNVYNPAPVPGGMAPQSPFNSSGYSSMPAPPFSLASFLQRIGRGCRRLAGRICDRCHRHGYFPGRRRRRHGTPTITSTPPARSAIASTETAGGARRERLRPP